ncbi:1-phosphofructokinase family hexose kinase [Brachybacterium sp. ACRRE]|uniref:1-phosphofructokinase family hexose kinase n=1 Tax=Brachybacterium sp. ACRRE TaxID=2918184 RepID=UPI001EF210C3|nr:1-phosphofructokinase family hexose kinase [Brachybacterium sp. ACRRE]MCG7310503.1 1-phosphofructokinase family hexose kinase [Brachybacterium sp. ACRRE]
MIRTLTANPSLDRTVLLGSPLSAGGVHRIVRESTQVGGKGVNVARALHLAGAEVEALVPVGADDPYRALLEAADAPLRTSPVDGAVRTNLTVLSPLEETGTSGSTGTAGTARGADDTGSAESPDALGAASGTVTTKLNEPGARISPTELEALESALLTGIGDGAPRGPRGQSAPTGERSLAHTVMLSGSLAPGFPEDWYARMVRVLHEHGAWAGVDTSDGPLRALAAAWGEDPTCAPDLLKPNALELAQLTGLDAAALDALEGAGTDLDAAELGPVGEAAQDLRAQGVREVLVTLGGAGALLASSQGTWFCPAGPTRVVSTVGAGDCATAGFLLARSRGEDAPTALARAVAYGSAAVALPGTTIPRPDQVVARPDAVRAL